MTAPSVTSPQRNGTSGNVLNVNAKRAVMTAKEIIQSAPSTRTRDGAAAES